MVPVPTVLSLVIGRLEGGLRGLRKGFGGADKPLAHGLITGREVRLPGAMRPYGSARPSPAPGDRRPTPACPARRWLDGDRRGPPHAHHGATGQRR